MDTKVLLENAEIKQDGGVHSFQPISGKARFGCAGTYSEGKQKQKEHPLEAPLRPFMEDKLL